MLKECNMDENKTINLRNQLRVWHTTMLWLHNDLRLGRLKDAEMVSRKFAGMCKVWDKQYKKQQSAAKRGLKHSK